MVLPPSEQRAFLAYATASVHCGVAGDSHVHSKAGTS